MKLTLEIIEKYDLPKKSYKPDWDDAGYEFTLPNGIVVSTLFMCNNEPCECDNLEGLDGYLYIDTEEELQKLISMSLDEAFDMIEKENPSFDRNYF